MRHLLTMLRWDVEIQIRNNVYSATVVSTLVICGFAMMLPWEPLPPRWTAVFVFLDPAAVGLAFVGATILMEKAAGTTAAMSVTPMPSWVYVLSKIVSLGVLGVLSGIVVAWVATDGQANWPLMIASLVTSNATACLIGFALVARARSMNDLNIKLLITGLIGYVAILGIFDMVPQALDLLLRISPSYAMMLSFQGAADPTSVTATDWTYAFSYQLAWIVAGWFWSLREFAASIVIEGR